MQSNNKCVIRAIVQMNILIVNKIINKNAHVVDMDFYLSISIQR